MNRTNNRTLIAGVALLLLAAPFAGIARSTEKAPNSQENPCPPVTNIEVEYLQGGKALIAWDAVPGAPKYFVKLEDDNLNILLDTAVLTNKVVASGLTKGRKYTVSVCYECPESGKRVCNSKSFRYYIIEDQVVMFENARDCHCKNAVESHGICDSSASYFYLLEPYRVYNVRLADDTEMSFMYENTINPVGNCRQQYLGMGWGVHGEYDSELAFYSVGNSRIYFHGAAFCVDGAAVAAITYCPVSSEAIRRENEWVAEEKVYPNPFSDWLTVTIENANPGDQETNIRLFNATGQQVFTENTRNTGPFPLPTALLRPGLYWLSITVGGQPRQMQRVLKVE